MDTNLTKVLAVLVNYGEEQLFYLEQVVKELKSFKKYDVTVIVNSNIDLNISGIDKVNVIALDNYQLLPLTCRKVLWENRNDYDIFIYGENDHLFLEKQLDNHILYSKILPKNRITGLIQIEKDETGIYYPGYHSGKGYHFEWDFNSVETYGEKKFAHFSNLHQATFILTKEQLLRIGKKIDFLALVDETEKPYIAYLNKIYKKIFEKKLINKELSYSLKCKVNTDIYKYAGLKKLICISDFQDNMIHHLPNVYIEGIEGRKKMRSDSERMQKALNRLLKK
ncbi:hypothetical protein [Flavobacterium sp.]|uniref:hypothetical protein n=1 Tax=Flavobacterium sp. TaxID=239 RepID=UPI00374DA8E2